MRILVVDDERAVRDALSRALRLHGFHVEEAPNGHAALQMLDAAAPDLVLLDVPMPLRSPSPVARETRRIGRREHGPPHPLGAWRRRRGPPLRSKGIDASTESTLMTRHRRRHTDENAAPSAAAGPSPTLARDAHAALAAFSLFQSVFAAAAADHAASSPIEVRLQLSEIAVDIARVGENLNLLASLLELSERVPTISPEVAKAVAAAGQALRSGPA